MSDTLEILALHQPGDLQVQVLLGFGAWMQAQRVPWRVRVRACAAREHAAILRSWRGHGALVAEQPRWRGSWLECLNFPVVNTMGFMQEPRLPSVLGDDQAIGGLLAEHLLQRGFRRLCFVGGDRYPGSNRAMGFRQAAQVAGVPVVSWSQVPERMPEQREPVGFACANDGIAHELLERCRADGLRVPETAAIVGINNDPLWCTLDCLGISSCDINLQRRGWEAAERLQMLLRGDALPCRILRVPPRGIVVRGSSDALAGADAVLTRAWAWLRAHSDAPIRLIDVAAASGVSRRSLERRVRERFGIGLQEAVWQAHVDRAKRLLQDSDQDLLGVALDCGFQSASAFATVFKRFTGMSPRVWRQWWRSITPE